MRTLILGLITLMASAMSQISLADGHLQSEKTSIANLSWMTGSWSGAMGPATLEENWTQAKDSRRAPPPPWVRPTFGAALASM